MNDEDLLASAASGDAASDGESQSSATPAKDTVELSKAEHAQLLRRLGDLEFSERYSAQRLKEFESAPNRAQQQEAMNEDDPEVDGDVADDFASNGIEALTKRGVLTRKEAKEMMREVAREVAGEAIKKSQAGLIQDAEMAREFPDLNDNGSELFKRTQAIYRAEIAEDPNAAQNPRTLIRAAKEARSDMRFAGIPESSRSQRGGEDGFNEGYSREESRLARVRAQSGNASRGRNDYDDDPDALDSEQQRIIARFNATGEANVSPEDYKKYAKKITLGSMPSGGGRR